MKGNTVLNLEPYVLAGKVHILAKHVMGRENEFFLLEQNNRYCVLKISDNKNTIGLRIGRLFAVESILYDYL